MSNLIRQTMNETQASEQTQRNKQRALASKWERTGLLEGVDNEYFRLGLAQMLENQAKQLIKEENSTNAGGATSKEEWNGVALPLVRRIFDEVHAKEFVSVQPMNLPSGLVFYLDFKYGTSVLNDTGNTGYGNQTTPAGNRALNSLFGVTDQANTDPAGGLYGAGRFGYTVNENTTTQALNLGATVGTNTFTTASVTFADINYDSDFSASVWTAAGGGAGLLVLTFSTGSFTRPDTQGVRAFRISGSSAQIVSQYPEYTKLINNGTQISFVVSASSEITNSGDFAVAIDYGQQPTSLTRGDFEARGTQLTNPTNNDLNIPEIDIELNQEAIVAKTRKLKAQWTPEMAQDLNAYHSIDAELELTSMLSEYISQEIDLEILDMLVTNANTTNYWSAELGFEYDSAASAFAQTSANVAAYNQGTWFQTLGTKIQKTSNQIHQKTMRGGANFLVVSPEVATILESIPGYAADTDGNQKQFSMGVQKIGAINGRFQVYKNPYFFTNRILMGYRGTQFLETGAVYAPYVPLIMTPLVYDPTNFTPRRAIMTRYAKKMIRPEFFGQVYVSGLDTI